MSYTSVNQTFAEKSSQRGGNIKLQLAGDRETSRVVKGGGDFFFVIVCANHDGLFLLILLDPVRAYHYH